MIKFKALILAGKTPEIAGKNKIFIDLLGKPVIKYVVDALEKSNYIDKIAIIGPKKRLEEIIKDYEIIPEQDNFYKNCIYGYNSIAKSEHIFFSYSDIPLVTPRAIDFFLKECTPDLDEVDLFVPICEAKYHLDPRRKISIKTMEGKFRTANFALANVSKIHGKEGVEKAYDLRKLYKIEHIINRISKENLANSINNVVGSLYLLTRLGSLIGYRNLIKSAFEYFVFHRFSLEGGKRILEEQLKTRAKFIKTPYAESVHDMDTSRDLEFIKNYLKQNKTKNLTA